MHNPTLHHTITSFYTHMIHFMVMTCTVSRHTITSFHTHIIYFMVMTCTISRHTITSFHTHMMYFMVMTSAPRATSGNGLKKSPTTNCSLLFGGCAGKLSITSLRSKLTASGRPVPKWVGGTIGTNMSINISLGTNTLP